MPSTSTTPTDTIPSMPTLPRLTLIVATTPSLGIGLRGALPWPPLKTDLAFFRHVTSRLPANTSSNGHIPAQNAVIMGRKTWDSIPAKFRPLKGRINVVITRGNNFSVPPSQNVFAAGSIPDALHTLRTKYPSPSSEQNDVTLGRVFVIGGAEIYRLALELDDGRAVERVLWTKIAKEFDCDTYFPVDLKGNEWSDVGGREMERWIGKEGVSGLKSEDGTEFEMVMLERSGLS